MSVNKLFGDQYLTYEMISNLKDPKRFWYQKLNGKIYLFDNLSVNIYVLKGSLASLFQTKEGAEFVSIIETMSWDETKSVYMNVMEILKSRLVCIDKTEYMINSIHFNLSNQCNLACKYCYKVKNQVELKDWSIVTRALELLVYDFGKNAIKYELGYCYTSEPLLKFQDLKKIISQANRLSRKINKQITVFFTTNGTILSEEILRYYKHIYRQFDISIDGCQIIHDAVRQFKNGSGTFSVIQKNIRKMKENNYSLHGSSVITRKYPFPAKVLNSLINLGFDGVQIKPIRPGNELSFTRKNIGELKDGYRQYFEMFYQDIKLGCFERIKKYKDDYALRFFRLIFQKQKIIRRCPWGIRKISMNHLGEFFPCDAVLNMEEFKIGNINTGIERQKFINLDVDVRNDCKSCWMRYLCGGTCYFGSWVANKDILSIEPIECELHKFLIKSGLELIFRLIDEEIDMAELKRIFLAEPNIN